MRRHKHPLRVTVITRRHLYALVAVGFFLVGLWHGAGLGSSDKTRAVMLPATLSMNEPVRQVVGVSDAMALTINVDWGNEVIPDLLEVLDQKEVRATFFLTGRWAGGFPDLARMIAERGHEIANHGSNHVHPTQLAADALDRHIASAVTTLKEAAGVEPVPLYAPPYGEHDRRVVEAARRRGHWTTLWTLDTIDWQNPSPATIVGRIVPRAVGGGIVLMHPKPQSLEALPAVIDGVREKGLTWRPLYEMIQEAAGQAGQADP